MAPRSGDIVIAEENGVYWPHVKSPRRPQRLTLEARVNWIGAKQVRILLPACPVTLDGKALVLPKTTISLERQDSQLSWETQRMAPADALEWRDQPFYPRIGGRWAAAERANYYTLGIWNAYQSHLGGAAAQEIAAFDDHRLSHAALLGVSPAASRAEVLLAFRAKAKDAHPDGGGSDEEFLRLTEARDALLSDG